MKTTEKKDLYEMINNSILEKLKNGVRPGNNRGMISAQPGIT